MKKLHLKAHKGSSEFIIAPEDIEGVKHSGKAIQLDLVGSGLLYVREEGEGETFLTILDAMSDLNRAHLEQARKAGESIK